MLITRMTTTLLLCLSIGVISAQNTVPVAAADNDEVLINLEETVVKIKIEAGVSFDQAVESMLLKANTLNMKNVGFQPLWKELMALGEKNVRRVEIYQFCDAKIAYEMLKHDINYAAYMPCRITLIEDESGQGWLVMANLNIFISSANLPKSLLKIAEKIRDNMDTILETAASGEL